MCPIENSMTPHSHTPSSPSGGVEGAALFYAPDIRTAPALPEDESAHAVRVLRLQAGDEIRVVDGTGGLFRAVIAQPHPKHCVVEVLEELPEIGGHDYRLHLAIAPTKNIERLEWCIEKATEIGVDEVTPFIGRFSERRVVKPERLERIIVSAAKQSLKSRFPVLNPLCTLNELLARHTATQRFIAHCYEGEKPLLQHACHRGADVLVLIGPEGDFSPEEVQRALAAGYQPVSLGTSRLRTETAGVVAVATVQLVNN